MAQETPAGSRPSPGDARQAVSEIIQKEADVAAAAAKPAPRRRDYRPAILLALGAMSAVLWLTDLPFLRPPEPPVLDPALRVANVRFALYLQVGRIEAYRRAHGHLPAALEEAGTPMKAVRYEREANEVFSVSLDTPDGSYRFRSGDSMQQFLGGSTKLLGLERVKS